MRSEHKITEEKIMEGTTTTETTGTQDMSSEVSGSVHVCWQWHTTFSWPVFVCVWVVMGSSRGCCRGRLGLSWRIVPQDQNTLQRIHSMRNISIYRSQWRANMLTSWHTHRHTLGWRFLNVSQIGQEAEVTPAEPEQQNSAFQTGSCAARPRFTSSQQ